MNLPVPHYINEAQSDIRSIKDGWYAMDRVGHLASGPYPSREDCLTWIGRAASGPILR